MSKEQLNTQTNLLNSLETLEALRETIEIYREQLQLHKEFSVKAEPTQIQRYLHYKCFNHMVLHLKVYKNTI